MKPLIWLGKTLALVNTFPREVRKEVGHAIYLGQCGDKSINTVPMVGFGSAKVLEVSIDCDGDTFRAVYTVKFRDAVYVLHAFQKKSHKGCKTPKCDLDLINARLKLAEAHYKHNYGPSEREERKHDRGG